MGQLCPVQLGARMGDGPGRGVQVRPREGGPCARAQCDRALFLRVRVRDRGRAQTVLLLPVQEVPLRSYPESTTSTLAVQGIQGDAGLGGGMGGDSEGMVRAVRAQLWGFGSGRLLHHHWWQDVGPEGAHRRVGDGGRFRGGVPGALARRRVRLKRERRDGEVTDRRYQGSGHALRAGPLGAGR